jgi:hypothetical protein
MGEEEADANAEFIVRACNANANLIGAAQRIVDAYKSSSLTTGDIKQLEAALIAADSVPF